MRKLLRKFATNKRGSEIVQQVIIIGVVVALSVAVTAWITSVVNKKAQEAGDKAGVPYTTTTASN